MKSAVTICLVPEAGSGPFVFHGDLPGSIRQAAQLGFDAVEVFPPAAAGVDAQELRRLLDTHALNLAAVGTGAGFLLHRLTLTDPDPTTRKKAAEFVRRIIDLAAAFKAPAIVGSMQGRHADTPTSHREALAHFADSLAGLGHYAREHGVPLLYEPLNRYETNLFNRQSDAAQFLRERNIKNVKILADLFHMNIEETNPAAALRHLADLLGHVHFVDSNRRAPGMGHIDYRPIIAALRQINYEGYLSAEALPLPDPQAAASQTVTAFKQLITDH